MNEGNYFSRYAQQCYVLQPVRLGKENNDDLTINAAGLRQSIKLR